MSKIRVFGWLMFVAALAGIFFLKYHKIYHQTPIVQATVPIYLKSGEDLRNALASDPQLVTQRNVDGKTLLLQIFIYRKPPVGDIQMLLQAGADPNATDPYGFTVLHAAAISGNPQIIQLLAQAGADLNKPDQRGRSPLKEAVLLKQTANAGALLSAGASLDVFSAAALGKMIEVDGMLSRDPTLMEALDDAKFSVIEWAAIRQQREVLSVIRSHGPKMDIFRAVVFQDQPEVAQLLDNKPALITSTDSHSLTVLEWAVLSNDVELSKYLLSRGADPNAANHPLFIAVRNGNLAIVKLLLDHGAKVTLSGEGTQDAYNAAVRAHHPEVAELIRQALK